MSRSDTSKLVSTSGRGIVLRRSRSIGNCARTCLIGEMEGEDLAEQQVEMGGEVVGKESSSNRIGQKGGRDQELLVVLQDILVMMIKLDCSWFILSLADKVNYVFDGDHEVCLIWFGYLRSRDPVRELSAGCNVTSDQPCDLQSGHVTPTWSRAFTPVT